MNPLKRPVQNQNDKDEDDKSTLNVGKIRTCEKCHRELPSTYRYSKCDNCRSQFAKTVAPIAPVVLAIAGFAVKYGPKVVKAVSRFIAKKK
jgi:hypothetical protein